MTETAISLPMRLDSYGRILQTYDQSKIWQDRVLSAVGTMVRERVQRPGFGTRLAEYNYAGLNTFSQDARIEIEKAFSTNLPLLGLIDVDFVVQDELGRFNITITYRLPNDKVDTVVVAMTAVGNKQQPYQESL